MNSKAQNTIFHKKHTARIGWIDLIETLAIFFVVFYHGHLFHEDILSPYTPTNDYIQYFFMTILSTCVPLFFFANGYLLFSKKIDFRKHLIRMFKLFLITIAWSIIMVFILMFVKGKFLSPHEFLHVVWYQKLRWNHILWFMGALICIYIFFPLLKITFDSNKKVFIFFVCILTLFSFGNVLLNQLISIFKVIVLNKSPAFDKNYFAVFNPFQGIRWWVFVYFCLGGIFYAYRDKVLSITPKRRNLISIITIIINCSLLFLIGLFCSRVNNEQYDVVFAGYNTIFTLCNTLAIVTLCLNYKAANPTITLISRNTLGIYFIHYILIELTRTRLREINILCNIPCSLLYATVILSISLGISIVLRKIPGIKNII